MKLWVKFLIPIAVLFALVFIAAFVMYLNICACGEVRMEQPAQANVNSINIR